MCVYIYVYVCVCMYVRMRLGMYVCMYGCLSMYVLCLYVLLCSHMCYVYINGLHIRECRGVGSFPRLAAVRMVQVVLCIRAYYLCDLSMQFPSFHSSSS